MFKKGKLQEMMNIRGIKRLYQQPETDKRYPILPIFDFVEGTQMPV